MCFLQANPSTLDRAEDLMVLRYLNESSALHVMRQRFAGNLPHTYAGPSLLIINPMQHLPIYSDKVGLINSSYVMLCPIPIHVPWTLPATLLPMMVMSISFMVKFWEGASVQKAHPDLKREREKKCAGC